MNRIERIPNIGDNDGHDIKYQLTFRMQDSAGDSISPANRDEYLDFVDECAEDYGIDYSVVKGVEMSSEGYTTETFTVSFTGKVHELHGYIVNGYMHTTGMTQFIQDVCYTYKQRYCKSLITIEATPLVFYKEI